MQLVDQNILLPSFLNNNRTLLDSVICGTTILLRFMQFNENEKLDKKNEEKIIYYMLDSNLSVQ